MTVGDGAVLGGIFARGGSKGLPRKNLQRLGGLTLVEHAVEAALRSGVVDEVLVSTDDDEIAECAAERGATVPFRRPAELAGDDAPEWLAWQHAVRWWRENRGPVKTLCSLPPTAPLRSPDDVARCVRHLESTSHDIVITVTPAARHPAFNMVRFDPTGSVRLLDPPARAVHRRQDATPVYDITTVCYAARADFVLRGRSIFSGSVGAIEVPRERSLDIDTELDLRIARCLLAGERATEPAGGA